MGTRKNLTIGVTVNLEHYENLRVEVSGEVDSADDARELAGFLDDVLGRFGRGDPATAGLVDSYRKRVLPVREPAPFAAEQAVLQTAVHPSGAGEAVLNGEPQGSAVPGPLPGATPHVPEPVTPAAGLSACEVCGSTVTAADQKMSRLFTGRTLCRVCLKKL